MPVDRVACPIIKLDYEALVEVAGVDGGYCLWVQVICAQNFSQLLVGDGNSLPVSSLKRKMPEEAAVPFFRK